MVIDETKCHTQACTIPKVYNLYHRLPRLLGYTQLPRPLGYSRLPRPVRVCSWGGWARNGIKVYNFYYRLPRPLGYTRLPRPLGYTRLPQYTNLYNTIRIIPILVGYINKMATDGGGGVVVAEVEIPTWIQFLN